MNKDCYKKLKNVWVEFSPCYDGNHYLYLACSIFGYENAHTAITRKKPNRIAKGPVLVLALSPLDLI